MTPQEEADERAALERELAAELAALADDEVDEEPDDQDGYSRSAYQRLDLEEVLRSVSSESSGERDDVLKQRSDAGQEKTWALLMESVAFCETQVFRVFDAEMDTLASQILPELAAVVQSVIIQRGGELPPTATDLTATQKEQAQEDTIPRGMRTGGASREMATARVYTENDSDRDSKSPTEAHATPVATINDTRHSTPEERIEGLQPVAQALVDSASLSNDLAVRAITDERLEDMCLPAASSPIIIEAPRQANGAEEPLSSQVIIPKRDASRRIRAQQNALRASQEMDAWLEAKQRQLELEQTQRECERRERDENVGMASEERATRALIEHHRKTRELRWMEREDDLSQRLATALARVAQQEDRERHLMAREEAREWKRRRLARETQRKERLVEEQSRVRRSHHRVMSELVAVVCAREEAKRKEEDGERRRAYREASAMRSEEHWMRRVLVLEKMARDESVRLRERQAMGREDTLASALQELERQELSERKRAHNERATMDAEETRSRIMETLWRLRVKRLRKWFDGDGTRRVRDGFVQWMQVVLQARIEQERAHRQKKDAAAAVIQRMVRRWRSRRRRQDEQETALAARVVQSAFRGFHVRRKFQNALDMAHRMTLRDGRVDDEFGEVDLEEWLGAPPELDDDWERPTVLPAASREVSVEEEVEEDEVDEQPAVESDNEEDKEDEEDEEIVRGDPVMYETRRVATPARGVPVEPPCSEGGTNLAAVLWNKMRRRTQRQRHAQEEKQKQQDPVYRAQKLLAKATPAVSSNSNQGCNQGKTNNNQAQQSQAATSITWATNADKKKAPKVKLPSLVERLRKKTAAAR